MTTCLYHPIYRSCQNCGRDMERAEQRECTAVHADGMFRSGPEWQARKAALREARSLIKDNAVSTWKSGQIERSDGLTDLLVSPSLRSICRLPRGHGVSGSATALRVTLLPARLPLGPRPDVPCTAVHSRCSARSMSRPQFWQLR